MTKLENIKSKTVWSALSLFFQSGYSAFLGLAANLVFNDSYFRQKFSASISPAFNHFFFKYFFRYWSCRFFNSEKKYSEDDVKSTFYLSTNINHFFGSYWFYF
jgi:hypothetical protein